MSVASIMAKILEDELREHGVRRLTRSACETIVRSMIQRTAELAPDIKERQLGPYPNEQT
jgi:hypothetical protein